MENKPVKKTFHFELDTSIVVEAGGKADAYSKVGAVLDSNYAVKFDNIKLTLYKMVEEPLGEDT